MNWIIEKMNALPYATTSNLEINAVQVGLFFIVIAYLSQFIQTQKNEFFNITLRQLIGAGARYQFFHILFFNIIFVN